MWTSKNIELEEHFFQTLPVPAPAPLKEQREEFYPYSLAVILRLSDSMGCTTVVSRAQTTITGDGCSGHTVTLPRTGGSKEIKPTHFNSCVSPIHAGIMAT